MKQSPKQIKVMGIGNPCLQSCGDCFASGIGYSSLSGEEEIEKLLKIHNSNPGAQLFPYPKDIGTSLYLLDLMQNLGITWGMTNGRTLDDSVIDLFMEKGVTNLKITLFASAEDQYHFNKNTPEQYDQIKKNIERAVQKGMRIDIFNVLDTFTFRHMEELGNLASGLGVSRVKFFRFLPVGNGKNLSAELLLGSGDMPYLIGQFEKMKQDHKDIYFSLGHHFGINFYGKSLEEAAAKISKSGSFGQLTPFPCPSVGEYHAAISLPSKKVYWCQFLISEPKIGIIGNLNTKTGNIELQEKRPDLRVDTLKKELRGICSSDNCEYQRLCLGGCRASAFLFSRLRGEEKPLYSGMDLCLTREYSSVFGKL